MSLEEIANEDMKINFSNVAGPPDLVYVGDPGIDLVEIVPTLSASCKADGKKICTKATSISWSAVGGTVCPHTSLTYTFILGNASILPSATKCKANGELVHREGDTSLAGCIGAWTLKVAPFTSVGCACAVGISDAGQTKVKAQ